VDLGKQNSEYTGRTLSRQAELAPDGSGRPRQAAERPGRAPGQAGIQLARGFIIPWQFYDIR